MSLILCSCEKVAMDETKESLSFDGELRTYLIHAPASPKDSGPVPLVLVLHGGGSNGAQTVQLTRGEFDRLSDRDDFVVVYPDGLHKHWNDGRNSGEVVYGNANGETLQDDVGFLSALIDRLIGTRNVDPRRVYVTGMSNGALMAYRLGCEIPDKLAAIAPVDGSLVVRVAETVSPRRPLAVLAINNTKDPLVPWNGGDLHGPFGRRSLGKVLSVGQTIEFWVRSDHAAVIPVVTNLPEVDPNDDTRVNRSEYGKGDEGSEVVLYTIEGGGHTWPGGVQYAPVIIVGKTSHQIDACQVIWEFFQRHVKSPSQ